MILFIYLYPKSTHLARVMQVFPQRLENASMPSLIYTFGESKSYFTHLSTCVMLAKDFGTEPETYIFDTKL